MTRSPALAAARAPCAASLSRLGLGFGSAAFDGPDALAVPLALDDQRRLLAEARARGISMGELASRVLSPAARDGLVAAVLDDDAPGRPAGSGQGRPVRPGDGAEIERRIRTIA